MPKRTESRDNRYENLLHELGFTDDVIRALLDEEANDRVVSQGLSVRLKTFTPYREICRRLNMNFCSPLQRFMERFVEYFMEAKNLQEALKRYGAERERMEKAAPRTSEAAKRKRRERREKKPCDRI